VQNPEEDHGVVSLQSVDDVNAVVTLLFQVRKKVSGS